MIASVDCDEKMTLTFSPSLKSTGDTSYLRLIGKTRQRREDALEQQRGITT